MTVKTQNFTMTETTIYHMMNNVTSAILYIINQIYLLCYKKERTFFFSFFASSPGG